MPPLADELRLSNGTRAQWRGRFREISTPPPQPFDERGAEAPGHEAGRIGCYAELNRHTMNFTE